jgi:hypothetical protein
MARYRIHRIKDTPRESFRWAAHMGGLAVVKPKDYEVAGEVEAPTSYAAWGRLLSDGRPLRPGDLLEVIPEGQPEQDHASSGELKIAKYIGFEPAKWYVPEPKPEDIYASADTSGAAGVDSSLQPA